jgi:hypothetical protein
MHPLFEKASRLTETIIAGAIEVHRDKGSGLIESIYEWCLTKEFEPRGLTCVSQKLVMIEYKGFTREETAAIRYAGGRVCGGRSKGRGEDSAHPQSPTPELHEIAEYPAWAAHQFP